jgi:hypothetical protein
MISISKPYAGLRRAYIAVFMLQEASQPKPELFGMILEKVQFDFLTQLLSPDRPLEWN